MKEDASQQKIDIKNLRSDEIMAKINSTIANKELDKKYLEYFANFKRQQETHFD